MKTTQRQTPQVVLPDLGNQQVDAPAQGASHVSKLQQATPAVQSQQPSFGAIGQDTAAQGGAAQAANFAQQANAAPSSSQSVLGLQMAEISGASTIQAGQAAAVQASQPSVPAQQVQATQAPAELTPAQQKEQVIQEFYAAMESKDFDKIMSLYHPDAVFTDPAFPDISGKKLRNMWKLITGNEGLVVKSSNVKVQNDGSVTGHWDADYELIKGNPIHNSIDSKFEFKDGKIIKHTDSFDFKKWADQALPGVFGKLAGTRVGHFLMQKVLLPFAIR